MLSRFHASLNFKNCTAFFSLEYILHIVVIVNCNCILFLLLDFCVTCMSPNVVHVLVLSLFLLFHYLTLYILMAMHHNTKYSYFVVILPPSKVPDPSSNRQECQFVKVLTGDQILDVKRSKNQTLYPKFCKTVV